MSEPTTTNPTLLALIESNKNLRKVERFTEGPLLSNEDISRELRDSGLIPTNAPTPTELLEPTASVAPATKPKKFKSHTALTKQFPLFSCSAFILYLQGVPTADSLQTLEALEAVTLDQIFQTERALTYRSLLGSGRTTKDYSEALMIFCQSMAEDSGYRLEFTSKLYQASNKEAHHDAVQFLVEGGASLQLNKCMHRGKATEALEAWKVAIINYLSTTEHATPRAYWLSKAGSPRLEKMTAKEFKGAMGNL